MEELKKLIEVLEENSTATALLNFADSSNLETQLYQLIKDGVTENENDIVLHLYGHCDKANAYKMLKSRVKKKLYNQLFFLSPTISRAHSENSIAELDCKKMLFWAASLRTIREDKLAKLQLQKALVLAEQYQLIECQIECYKLMRVMLSNDSFSKKEFVTCTAKLEELYKLLEYEKRANQLYFDIKFEFKQGVIAGAELLDKLKASIVELKECWLQFGLNSVFKRYHSLMNMYYEITGDVTANISYLEQTFALYKAGKIHPAYYSETYNKFILVHAYLKNKDYSLGLAEAAELKKNLAEGSKNWFAHLENYFLLALHSKDYSLSEEILIEVFSNKCFRETNQFAQERWSTIYQIYHNAFGFKIPAKLNKKLKLCYQDKKGFNLWLMILDYMIALDSRDVSILAREVDRIKKYIGKYLTAPDDTRSKYMLKLLLIAGREFPVDAATCRKKGEYLFKKLQQAPTPGYAYAETEIIPYEDLWDVILQKLDNNL